MNAHPVCCHPDHAPDDFHTPFVDDVVRAFSIESEAVVDPPAGNYLAFAGTLQLSTASPLGCLHALEAGNLVHDFVRELVFWGVVAPVVEGPEYAAPQRKLLSQ
jgi:hypothetical protein